MPRLQLKERCQESRRVDYASLSFHVGTRRKMQDAFDEVVDVLENVGGGFGFEEQARPSMHYDRVFTNDLECRIELTQPDSGLRNAGRMLVSIPGRPFYLQTSGEQAFMLYRLIRSTGYRWFTRLDLQNTQLEPEFNTDSVFQAVLEGKLWVKGYSCFRPGGDIEADLTSPKGQTVYWGSRRSDRQGRTYDKAKDGGWKTEAIRDELQLRGAWAKAYGEELAKGLAAAHTTDDMADSVSALVVSGLNNHLQYWTLNGTHPKTDKNWQRKAEVADWFTRRIGTHQEPIRKPQRPEHDLDAVVSYGVQQYGRSFALWVARYMETHDCTYAEANAVLVARFQARMKPEDEPYMGFLKTVQAWEANASEELFGMDA